MSLILDALKKSEAERQRHAGPTMLDVRIARPQRRYPVWAFIVGGLLLVNIALLLVFVLRRPDAAMPAAASTPAAAAAAPTTAAPSAAASGTAVPGSPPPLTPPVTAAPATNAAAASPDATSMRATAPTLADDTADNGSMNPADEEPALPAAALSPRTANGNANGNANGSVKYQRDNSSGYSSLPSYSELGGNLPPLRLDLHVYAEAPRERYAMINMQSLHEGDTLSEGARVLAITRDGVALDYHGQQFILRPQ
jgi:general secretion pathway protein B